MIDQSETAKFLNGLLNSTELAEYMDRAGLSEWSGSQFLYQSELSPFAAMSRTLAEEASGNVLISIGESARFDSIFFVDELPRILSNANVTEINGVPKAKFIFDAGLEGIDLERLVSDPEHAASFSANGGFNGVKAQVGKTDVAALHEAFGKRLVNGEVTSEKVFDTFLALNKANVDGFDGNLKIPYMKIGSQALITIEFTPKQFEDFSRVMERLTIGKIAKFAGALGTTLEVGLKMFEVGQVLERQKFGDLTQEEAQIEIENILAETAGGVSGGVIGSVIGAILGAVAVSSLTAITGGVALLIIGASALVAGFAGAHFGEKLALYLKEVYTNYSGDPTLLPDALGENLEEWLVAENQYDNFVIASMSSQFYDENPDASILDLVEFLTNGAMRDPLLLDDKETLLNAIGHAIWSEMTGDSEVRLNMYEMQQYEILWNEYMDHTATAIAELDGQCFPHDVKVAMWDGSFKEISQVNVGDIVQSYQSDGSITRGVVTKLFRGVTKSWVELTYSYRGERHLLVSTPGHPFLTANGDFRPIASLINSGGCAEIVLADGTVVTAQVREVHYSSSTANNYAQAYITQSFGSLALSPEPQGAWETFNFEVEDTHTYIAENVRVHNRCQKYHASAMLVDALKRAGLIDDDMTLYEVSPGQFIIFAPDGTVVNPDELGKEVPFTQAFEWIKDMVAHTGHAIAHSYSQTGAYISEALPGLVSDLVRGLSFDEAAENAIANMTANFSIDTLAHIFGLEAHFYNHDDQLDTEQEEGLSTKQLAATGFFTSELGAAIKEMLITATIMDLLTDEGESLSSEDYERIVVNESVKFVVNQFLQTKDWALELADGAFSKNKIFEGIYKPGGAQTSHPMSAAGAAASQFAFTLITDLLDGGFEDDWASLGNAAIAAGSAYVTAAFTAQTTAISLGTLPFGMGPVAFNPMAAIIGAVVTKVFSNIFGSWFAPPPPLLHKEVNDDGTISVYVTDESGGYIYQVSGGTANHKIFGGSGHDTLTGNDGDNEIHGGGGSDFLSGRGGNDTITGGTGSDMLYAGTGDDTAIGGQGHDFIDGGDGNDRLIGGDGDDLIFGDSEDDEESFDHDRRAEVSRLGEESVTATDTEDTGAPEEGGDADEEEEEETPEPTHNCLFNFVYREALSLSIWTPIGGPNRRGPG